MDDLARLGLHLIPRSAASRARAVLGGGADDVRDTARSLARSKGWSDTTVEGIYARMARGTAGDPTSFVFAKGPAAWNETGTSRHGPDPVVGPAVDQHADALEEILADAIEGLF